MEVEKCLQSEGLLKRYSALRLAQDCSENIEKEDIEELEKSSITVNSSGSDHESNVANVLLFGRRFSTPNTNEHTYGKDPVDQIRHAFHAAGQMGTQNMHSNEFSTNFCMQKNIKDSSCAECPTSSEESLILSSEVKEEMPVFPYEKRPRIERPQARYPNSTRRTSAPACLWSATTLIANQVVLNSCYSQACHAGEIINA